MIVLHPGNPDRNLSNEMLSTFFSFPHVPTLRSSIWPGLRIKRLLSRRLITNQERWALIDSRGGGTDRFVLFSQEHLSESECDEHDWDSNSAGRFPILSR